MFYLRINLKRDKSRMFANLVAAVYILAVIISDDGVGFDMEEAKKKQETQSDGKSHVGMENTRRRLQDMCGGRIVTESTPGEGTVVTVILPKKGQGDT